MLKKWKRWKLGKDIDEEYRHTHSHTPHIKSGSIATGNLPYPHDNNTSDPSGDSPRLNKADRAPSCSAAPEENRRLVVSYSNGTGKGQPAKSRHTLQFSFLPRRVTASHISTATEDVCLEEKAQCRSHPPEGEETNVWEQCPLGPHHENSHWLCLSWFSDQCLSCVNETAYVWRQWGGDPNRSPPYNTAGKHSNLPRCKWIFIVFWTLSKKRLLTSDIRND